jgi:hypothetical protein
MLRPAPQRAFWRELSGQVRSRELQQAFKRRFQGALERRFGKSIEALHFYPVPMLLRDLGGYRIGVHGDSMSKRSRCSSIFRPTSRKRAHGNALARGRDGDAAAHRSTPFLPATAYALPVIRHESWHSVAKTSQQDGERNSSMLTHYGQENAADWVVDRLKRLWLFLVYAARR